MNFKRKQQRKDKHKLRCCGQQMTYKNGYGYVCEKCGKTLGGTDEAVSLLDGEQLHFDNDCLIKHVEAKVVIE